MAKAPRATKAKAAAPAAAATPAPAALGSEPQAPALAAVPAEPAAGSSDPVPAPAASDLIAVRVRSATGHARRRAGQAFGREPIDLDVSEETLALLEADPQLTVERG